MPRQATIAAYVGATITVTTTTGDGGTNLTAGSKGTYFGINPIVNFSGANIQSVVGDETDVVGTGSGSTEFRYGKLVTGQGSVRAATAINDAAYEVAAFSTTSNWQYAYQVSLGATGTAPVATTGTILGTDGFNFTVANGVDLSALTITGSSFKGPSSFNVDGPSGVISATGAILGNSGAFIADVFGNN